MSNDPPTPPVLRAPDEGRLHDLEARATPPVTTQNGRDNPSARYSWVTWHTSDARATESDQTAAIQRRLLDSRREGHKFRLVVSGVPFLLAVIVLVVGIAVNASGRISTGLARNESIMISRIFVELAIVLAQLSLLRTDGSLVRYAAVGRVVLSFIFLALFLPQNSAFFVQPTTSRCGGWEVALLDVTGYVNTVAMQLWALGCIIYVLLSGNGCSTQADNAQSRSTSRAEDLLDVLWFTLGCVFASFVVRDMVEIVSGLAVKPRFQESTFFGILVLWLVEHLFLAYVALSDGLRAQIHTAISSRSAKLSAAAGLSSLLGGVNVSDAMVDARQRLHVVPADRITREVFSGPPMAFFNTLSDHATLADVDCFVSHSWWVSSRRLPCLRGVGAPQSYARAAGVLP